MWTWPWSRPVAKQPTPAEVEAACAFCGKPRADVRLLIAGPRAAICDACVSFAVAAADCPEHASRAEPFPALKAAVREVIVALPSESRHGVSSPLLAAAEALATTPAERHNLSLEAFRMRNSPAALRLLDVPDATPTMILNAATCWLSAGRPGESLVRLRAMDTSQLKPVDQAQHRLNLAAALLAIEPVDVAEVEAVLTEAEGLLASAAEDKYARSWQVCAENSRGDIAMLQGDWALAESRYRAALAGGAGEDAFTWRRLGDVLRRVGRLDEAQEAWERALAMAHPDTSIAADLRERIAGLARGLL